MKKLLIIDDDQLVANIYRNKFVVEGFEVETALDGEEGLTLIEKSRPDAVILDLMLPKLSGVDLLKQVRAKEEFKTTPIIVFSNTYLSSTVQEAWKAGATKCLSKSTCTPKQILDVIRNAFVAPAKTGASPKQAEPAPPKPPAPEPAKAAEPDRESLEEIRSTFVESLKDTLMVLRGQLQAISKAPDETQRKKSIDDLCRKIHTLTGNAAVVELHLIAQFADAFEALLKELSDKPKQVNASTLRTVALAVDFLGFLFDKGTDPKSQELGVAKAAVVDDEPLSRRAVTHALEKARMQSVTIEDPLYAMKLLPQNRFDVIFLDVDMPGMSGFELCSKIRAMHVHKKTPVVFVTGLTDFESRANSMMSGGNDLIAKPFLFTELAVKALMHVIRSRLDTPR